MIETEKRHQVVIDDTYVVRVLYDSEEPVEELSPYRFRIVDRDAGYIGIWTSVEEFINGKWMMFRGKNNKELVEAYCFHAGLNPEMLG